MHYNAKINGVRIRTHDPWKRKRVHVLLTTPQPITHTSTHPVFSATAMKTQRSLNAMNFECPNSEHTRRNTLLT